MADAGVEEREQGPELVERVAAIDIAKASGMVCTRVPHEDKPGQRTQRVWNVTATSGAILDLTDHLICQGITRIVMESTSTYWKPSFFLLEARGLECWLVNARDVKNVPGRPKTDKLDAVWLAKLAERGMLRASFVPPKPVRELRDLTRSRAVERPVQLSVSTAEQQGAVVSAPADAVSGWQPGAGTNWAELFGRGGGFGAPVSQPVEQWQSAPVEQPVQFEQPASFGGDNSGGYYG